MMKNDIQIYNELAAILYAHAPRDSAIIKLKFVIEVEENSGAGVERFYFDYIDTQGYENWFDIGVVGVPSKIGDLCLELREFMIKKEQGKWCAFNFFIDVGGKKFEANFDYQNQ
jgi:hypothetical protein